MEKKSQGRLPFFSRSLLCFEENDLMVEKDLKTIYYISTLRLPTEKAYGVNMVKTCEALGQQGIEVKLITPRFRHLAKESVYEYYGAKRTFTLILFPFIDVVSYVLALSLKLWKWKITSRSVFSWRWLHVAFLLDQGLMALT